MFVSDHLFAFAYQNILHCIVGFAPIVEGS